MNFKLSLTSAAFVVCCLATGATYAQGPGESQKVTLNQKVRIPGAVLKAGDYTFAVEDRLQDRAIVRITSQDDDKHFLLLTVPSEKLSHADADSLIRFATTKGKEAALLGWACPGCSRSLEFVYPKAEAAELTDETAEPVLAVDPTSDKLPANLSPDDMKVVTLWLLSPETITAGNKGKGVKAERWVDVDKPGTAVAASNVPPQQSPTEAQASQRTQEAVLAVSPTLDKVNAQASPVKQAQAQQTEAASAASLAGSGNQLPKTASNNFLYLISGMGLTILAFCVHIFRRYAVPVSNE